MTLLCKVLYVPHMDRFMRYMFHSNDSSPVFKVKAVLLPSPVQQTGSHYASQHRHLWELNPHRGDCLGLDIKVAQHYCLATNYRRVSIIATRK